MRAGRRGGSTAACLAPTHLLTARLRAARGRAARGGGEKRKLRRAPPGARGARGRAARRRGALLWNRHPPPSAPGSDLQIAGMRVPCPAPITAGCGELRRFTPRRAVRGTAGSLVPPRCPPSPPSLPPNLPSGRAGPVLADRRWKPEAGNTGEGREGVGRRPLRGPRPGGGVM